MPEAIWQPLRLGIDFEWLPFAAGYTPPRVNTAGWSFAFRFARFLQPLVLLDAATEIERPGVVAQFADSSPPAYFRGNAPPYLVIGLWGGLLEGTSLRIATDPATGHVAGTLEW